MTGGGFPHSEIHGSGPADGSPWLIAVCRVLPRLVVPRHPSCARIRLARNFSPLVTLQFSLIPDSLFKDRKMVPRRLVGLTGVEPVTSSLSGTRSNQLSYKPRGVGGGSRIRTGDFLLAKQALYQLSHAPRGGDAPGPVGREAGHGSGGGMRAARAAPQLRDLDGPCSSERR